jgi:hypothetical protein
MVAAFKGHTHTRVSGGFYMQFKVVPKRVKATLREKKNEAYVAPKDKEQKKKDK